MSVDKYRIISGGVTQGAVGSISGSTLFNKNTYYLLDLDKPLSVGMGTGIEYTNLWVRATNLEKVEESNSAAALAFRTALKNKKERGWDTVYWCIDVHDTILKGKYESDQDYEFYPDAIKVLKWISEQEDHRIIIWTCSYAKEFDRLRSYMFCKYGIRLDYHNENPECGDTEIAEFTDKFYFNILLDDKAGFDARKDWTDLKNEIGIH